MSRILAVSSHVVRGAIGNSAVVPALWRLGHEVWPLPSIVLSNHPGHAQVAGEPIPEKSFAEIFAGLEANGWLGEIDAVLTGYLPGAGHVEIVREWLLAMRARRVVTFLCDPVLGDTPSGLYVAEETAEAIRDRLLGLADIATPNCFELAWLTGTDVGNPRSALDAAARLAPATVVATSVAVESTGRVANLLALKAKGGDIGLSGLRCDVARLGDTPHGSGDLLAGLFLGHLLDGASRKEAFALAVAGVDIVLRRSLNRDELDLSGRTNDWLKPDPAPLTEIADAN